MKQDCTVGVFNRMPEAEQAVHILNRAGFDSSSMSLVTQHVDPESALGRELEVADDSLHDAAIGATLGGLVTILGETGVFLVTGMGAFIAAGPLVAVMGAVVGGLLGGMRGWGLHDEHIRKYEDLLQSGHVLVVVQGNPIRVQEAKELLTETDATEVHVHAQTSDDDAEISKS